MSLPEILYETGMAAARPLFGAAALVHGGARRAVRGRRDSLKRFEAWGASGRDPERPLVWVHAPSVGEALMAQAMIRALRAERPDLQVAFTHFSPSAERIADTVGADVSGYSPWDTRGPVRRAFAALRPTALAFVRTEIWPVATREAARRGTGLFLVNAVLSAGSGRLSRRGRKLLGRSYRRLDGVGAVSTEHATRYELLGVPSARIRVTGDARFDQVVARVDARGLAAARAGDLAGSPGDVAAIFRLFRDPGRFTLVAGSTWGADEKILVAALGVLRNERRVRIVIAPHEPTSPHLRVLEERLDRAGLRHARLGALLAAGPGAAVPNAVIVDRLGVLADLYAVADLAYVGGGLGPSGLHSVVEPAALGVPVLFGPRHGNAREAAALAAAGGGFVIEGAGDVESWIRRFATDATALAAAGSAAAAYVRTETGAAERNAALILSGPGGTTRAQMGTRTT